MLYRGKQIDLFEPAIKQMLQGYEIEWKCSLDCISLRCFGYGMGNSVSEWFCPLIGTEESASVLADVLKIPVRCQKENWPLQRKLPDTGCVIGPLKRGIAVPEIRNYYYNGCGRYLFLRDDDGDSCRVFDPQGLPGVLMKKESLVPCLDGTKVFVLYLQDQSAIPVEPDARDVWKRGIEFHKMIAEREQIEMERALNQYVTSYGNRLSLQYGVMNLLLQLDKVFQLAYVDRTPDRERQREYLVWKQSMYQAAKKEAMDRIPTIFRNIWELLENAGEF